MLLGCDGGIDPPAEPEDAKDSAKTPGPPPEAGVALGDETFRNADAMPREWSDSETVQAFVETAPCTTTVVHPLSMQLLDELECLNPGTMDSIDSYPEIDLGRGAFPVIQRAAAEHLAMAAAAAGGLTLNSSLRTIAQQYLLYEWFLRGKCDISLAAKPGTSNHESGLAVDVAEKGNVQEAMQTHGFEWFGSRDAVHYDYVGDDAIDLRRLSVKAFQRLWNLNVPENPVEVDGVFGEQTQARLSVTPADGFPLSPTCAF